MAGILKEGFIRRWLLVNDPQTAPHDFRLADRVQGYLPTSFNVAGILRAVTAQPRITGMSRIRMSRDGRSSLIHRPPDFIQHDIVVDPFTFEEPLLQDVWTQ